MIGAIIGAGLSIASSVAGGIANRKAAKQKAAELRRQEQRQKAYYDRVMGEDATQRADVQRLITICLLYTSPSPRDPFQSRMPSSA